MRHRAGDDVVVVSRPSLTKSSQQIPHSEIHLRLDPETDGRFEEEGGCSISHGNGTRSLPLVWFYGSSSKSPHQKVTQVPIFNNDSFSNEPQNGKFQQRC
ncbi:hypothetical protein HZH68_011817 [Vespula germanica]|uniref:Uncharacterized protein n=2 Tax=Vespula TaxID=7451 RepID=A0A834MZ85_VESGE|nr:hypothetical protein HZH68_011817 [Vespula germanica]KAF7412886.1 hypothetical protein H0235_012737 [Vespula pensylvanica]